MLWVGLVFALLSAVAINWAYTLEHAAAIDCRRSRGHPIAPPGALSAVPGWARVAETGGWISISLRSGSLRSRSSRRSAPRGSRYWH